MNLMLANFIVETFLHGGWVMWPVLFTFFLALCVLTDRIVWWSHLRSRTKSKLHEAVRENLGNGNFSGVWTSIKDSTDPYLINLAEGIRHARTSMTGAMQLHATHLIEKSEARMWVLSTIITLAPLLGLLGTIVGIMQSFKFVGNDELAASKVSGGIGEALIATACGLSIAILCLLPYNYYRKRSSLLRGSLERWINHAELLVASAKSHGHDLEAFVLNHLSKER